MRKDNIYVFIGAGVFIFLSAIPIIGMLLFSLLLFLLIMYIVTWTLYKINPKLWKTVHESELSLFKIIPDLYKLMQHRSFNVKYIENLAKLSFSCLAIQLFVKFLIIQ